MSTKGITQIDIKQDELKNQNLFDKVKDAQEVLLKLLSQNPQIKTQLETIDNAFLLLYEYAASFAKQDYFDQVRIAKHKYDLLIADHTANIVLLEEATEQNAVLENANSRLIKEAEEMRERLTAAEKQIEKLTRKFEESKVQDKVEHNKDVSKKYEKLTKEKETRDKTDKYKEYRMLVDIAFQFEKYVCKYLFPRENPLIFGIKIKRLDQTVEAYVSSHFPPEERQSQTQIIHSKIAHIKLRDIENCDEILKSSKNLRLSITHNSINDPEAYKAPVVRSMMGKSNLRNLAYPLLDVLEKLSPDDVIFTDVFERDFENIS